MRRFPIRDRFAPCVDGDEAPRSWARRIGGLRTVMLETGLMSDLNVAIRNEMGTRACRRLRNAGSIPAVLYGHGEQSVHLTIPGDDITSAIRHGTKLVNLTGGVSESALISDVQWDTFGVDVLHLDLTRVSADERVEVTVAIEVRGEAPGVKAGGVINLMLHEIAVECLVTEIPDKFQLNINTLELEGTITVADLELPAGATLKIDPETIVVQCVEAKVDEEEEEGDLAESAEPEVIGGRPDEDDSGSDD